MKTVRGDHECYSSSRKERWRERERVRARDGERERVSESERWRERGPYLHDFQHGLAGLVLVPGHDDPLPCSQATGLHNQSWEGGPGAQDRWGSKGMVGSSLNTEFKFIIIIEIIFQRGKMGRSILKTFELQNKTQKKMFPQPPQVPYPQSFSHGSPRPPLWY